MKMRHLTRLRKRLILRAVLLGLLLLFPLVPAVHAQSGGGYELKNAAFTSGSDSSTNGAYRLSGTFSQSFPGTATNDGYALTGDFVSINLLVTGRSCVEPPPGLVNWWTFDEKAGTSAHDIAGVRDNIGTLNSFGMNPPTHVLGKVKNALRFNGTSQWMEVSHRNEVDFLGTCFPATDGESFTIDVWIKPEQATGTAMLLDKRDSTLRGYTLSLVNGFLKVELNTSTGHVYQGTSFLAANQWHFIAVSYERCANVLRMYVDGSLTPVDTFSTPVLDVLANNEKLFVGRQRGPLGPPNFYAGCLDELAFFKRVLTDDEIHSIWAADSAGQCKPGANVPRYQLAAGSAVAGQLTFKWSGDDAVLQAAETITNSWIKVEGATSGFRVEMDDPRGKFYRLAYP